MSSYRDPRYPYSAGPRHSTTSVYDTSFDTRFGAPSRNGYDYPPSSSRGRPYTTAAAPRSSLEPSHAYGNYTTRTRRNSSTEPYARSSAASLSDYNRPVVRAHDGPRSPVVSKLYAPGDEKVIYPASSRKHERHNSATTDDISRIGLQERERLERSQSHRNSYVARSKDHYPASSSSSRKAQDDDYSYTGPREQFERDYPVRPRQRRDSYTRSERPVSMIDYGDRGNSTVARREPPPASAKHFERLDKQELLRPGSRSGSGSNDLDRDIRRRESVKKPVSVHQYEREEESGKPRDGYSDRRPSRPERSYEDEKYMSDRERHHRSNHHDDRSSKHRHDRHESKDRSGISSTLAGIGASGLAALGAVALKDKSDDKHAREKEKDRDEEARRREKERRHQERELLREQERRERQSRELPTDPGDRRGSEQVKERSDSDSGRERHRHRHRRDEETSLPEVAVASGALGPDDEPQEPREHRHRHRHKHRRHRSRDSDAKEKTVQYENEDGTVESPVDMRAEEPSRPRKSVTLVEPAKDAAPEVKPRGILKKPTEKFPEEPTPHREGVALFKDDPKKTQIPAGAKWTKIKRIAVSPAACEAMNERYEPRDDYVIVLRPLTREEIQKLADKTIEIRKNRAAEEKKRERARQPEEDESYSSDSSFTSSTDSYTSDGERSPERRSRTAQQPETGHEERPLPIEAPPQHYVDPIVQMTQAAQAPPQPQPAFVPAYAPPPHQQAPYQQQMQMPYPPPPQYPQPPPPQQQYMPPPHVPHERHSGEL